MFYNFLSKRALTPTLFPYDNIPDHRITGHECLQGFLVDGIEMVGLEGESLLKTDRKVERIGEFFRCHHAEPFKVIACFDGLDDLGWQEDGHTNPRQGLF